MYSIHNPIKTSVQILLLFFVFSLLAGCSNSKNKKVFLLFEKGEIAPKGIAMIYPFDGTIFPPELPAPSFEWKDSTGRSSQWNVFISDSNGKLLISSASDKSTWKPDSVLWEKMKQTSLPAEFSFTVISSNKASGTPASNRIRFSVSKDSVGADIFFRAVTLPFSYAVRNVNTIEWYMGSVDGSKPRKMLDNLPVCGNCHSFAKEQPLLAMDVDYGNDKGSYAIAKALDTCRLTPKDIITWSDYKKEEEEATFGLLSQISPDGNYVLSTVKDLSIFVAVDNNLAYSQLFFPIKGIVGIYDRKKETFDALKGADDSRYVQSNPSWSPDGKKVVFARTEAYINEKVKKAGKALLSINDVAEFSTGGKQFKYDLYSVDFNNGEGGVATPLEGASNNGKSNYFPKFSPDGKWIVFCQAENFMLLQPDSRLFIMPSTGGKPRLMNCNMNEMNSWHSWSPNGRWLVFSSKSKGLYTQLYLTHIDENGMDSPPVLLENLRFDKRAANIPEFFPFESKHFKVIKDNFSSTPEYFNRVAFDAMSNKYYKRAMENLTKAMDADPNYLETYFNRIMLNSLLKQANSREDVSDKEKAMKLVLKTLAQNPNDLNYLSLKISLLANIGKIIEAEKEVELAIQKHPDNYKLYEQATTIYRKLNKSAKVIDCYNQMINIAPEKKASLTNQIIGVYMQMGKNDEAMQLLNQLIKNNPDGYNLKYSKAQILLASKKPEQAKKEIDFIISKDSTNYKYIQLLAQYYFMQGDKRLSFFNNQRALNLLEKECAKNIEDFEAIFELATLYISFKDLENAERWYNHVLKYFPLNHEALKQKARIKLNMQQWNEAIAIYDQLENNYLPEEEYYNNKAIAYIQSGNNQKALENFDKAIALNPNNKDAIFNRERLKSSMR